MPADFSAYNQLQTGDETAWEMAFQRLWPIACHAARHPSLGLSAEDVEDTASEALAQVVPKVRTIADFQELEAFTATVAYRRAASLTRRKMARKRSPGASASPHDTPGVPAVSQAPAVPLDHLSDNEIRELARLLALALANLDDETRWLLHEKIGQGKSYQELSRLQQKPLPTLAARVSRGLSKVLSTLRETPELMQQLLSFLR
jgi:RNA polymerase sigma factor (sigma-70 family)